MSRPIIEVEGLSKRYRLGQFNAGSLREESERFMRRLRGRQVSDARVAGDFWALDDVSFKVERGEVLGVIGRNGAGKSTLLKILSRVTEPTRGQARIRGRVASLLEVGTGFHPELTGRENVFLNGAILGMTHAEIAAKFDEIVAFAEVDQFLDTPVKRYSSGMYVRLAFAVAAHLEPEVLIVDEVLAVGDVEFQRKCLGKMQEVSSKGGRTVLFVSHNMNAINELCSRALLLSGGVIAADGKPSAAIEAYMRRTKSEASADLTSAPRVGPGQFGRFQRLGIFGDDGGPTTTFYMNSGMTVEVDYECTKAISGLEIGVKISNRYGAVVHYLNALWEGQPLNLSPGLYRLRATVPALNLFPGQYFVGAWALKPPDLSAGDDNIHEAAQVTMIKSDVTGFPTRMEDYNSGGSAVYTKSSWEVSRLDSRQVKRGKLIHG